MKTVYQIKMEYLNRSQLVEAHTEAAAVSVRLGVVVALIADIDLEQLQSSALPAVVLAVATVVAVAMAANPAYFQASA